MYLNQIQLAESFGVAEAVVEGWIRDEGLPCTQDRGRLLFDRAQVAEWAARRGLAAKAGFLAPSTTALRSSLSLGQLLRTGGIWRDVPEADLPSVFDRVVAALPDATSPIRKLLGERLRAKGGVTLAPVGVGFAFPHPSSRIALGRDSGTIALLIMRKPLSMSNGAPDGVPITRLFFFIAPSPRAHLEILGRLGRGLSRGGLRKLIADDLTDADIFREVDAIDALALEPAKPEVKS